MSSSNQIWIKSTSFEVEEGEDSETNKGVYGKAFSQWLASKLKENGEEVVDVIAEDWGRCILLKEKPPTFIGCANRWGETTEWGVFVEVKEGLVKSLLGGGSSGSEVRRLEALLEKILRGAEEVDEFIVEPS